MIHEKKVENSSWVFNVKFDTEKKTMEVEPKQGNRLLYRDFTQQLWDEMINSESVGTFLHRVVKPLYNKKPEDD